MVQIERKRNTYMNWKYAIMILFIPLGFYLVSRGEDISTLQHIAFISITIWLAFVGVFGITNRYQALKVYGYLYFACSVIFAYTGLVVIW